ncbi:unnamed protein product [Brassica napus]|uniref:(rape) hypothetical protein n=1 Tax=Brassica napus TaxID=3708 RepID=A0A816TDL7_BRANA|nr:unnamed protein product [Brassica napus]
MFYSPWRTDSQIQSFQLYIFQFHNCLLVRCYVGFTGYMMKLYFMGNLRLNLLDAIFMIF